MAINDNILAGELQSPATESHTPEPGGSAQNGPVRNFAPGIEAAFPREFQEGCRPVECVAGKIPDFVRGTYYLNGPARFAIDDLAYQHWLDGDGMVSALRFGAREIFLTNRYVRSTKFETEKECGRPLFRAFGTSFPGSRLNGIKNGLESPVNVSVYRTQDRLLAFGEQGLPWAMNPQTLETLGQATFNGRLNHASPFSAHPKFDADTGEMFNFGVFFSAQVPRLYLYCFDVNGLRYRKAVPLEYSCSVHDFSISKHYAIFYLSPYLLDLQPLLQDGRSVLDSLQWAPERGSTLMVVDRRSGHVVASLPIGRRYCLHLMNSFEREDGFLVVDLLEFDAPVYGEYQPIPTLFENVASGGPVRFIIDLKKGEAVQKIAAPYLSSPDFPAIDPRLAMKSYSEFWMLGISSAGSPGRKFFDQLVHGSWNNPAMDVYQSGPMRYLSGEPVVISARDSDEAVVVCQEMDASERASYFLLFDAQNVSAGPIARIAAGQMLYLGFHAMFHPES
jgi:all-trans-8'-apo-beta-carotenal 15,15'-oxygenase